NFGIKKQRSSEAQVKPKLIKDMTVLIVDDNAYAREILHDMLINEGIKADVVEDSHKAIMHVKQSNKRYDLILMDWQMPNICGIQTAQKIKSVLQNSFSKDPIIIMMTAYGRAEVQAEAKNTDINIFLDKPITISNLIDAISSTEFYEKRIRKDLQSINIKNAATQLKGCHVLLVEDN
ncbi:hypothetical protein CJF42_06440, partial [Pseudoalteromonas sp. NBT06-2]|uniref:response regulator n=1 Tax=Pseudoalteromonas sp. NBT06-2 TaxID=2025950 RepID=UPI000BC8A821